MQKLVIQLAQLLLKQGYKITTVESCTGGLVAEQCTQLAGSSAWFDRGYITYSNESKVDLVKVNKTDIKEKGAVSQSVAEAMAKGALQQSLANLAVSITGIAGPTGGSAQKPVGTVWIAWATANTLNSHCFQFKGNREAVRQQAAAEALKGLIKAIA